MIVEWNVSVVLENLGTAPVTTRPSLRQASGMPDTRERTKREIRQAPVQLKQLSLLYSDPAVWI